MEGISTTSGALIAPQPATPFEAYVIRTLQQHTSLLNQHTTLLTRHSILLSPEGPIFRSIMDLAESIAFIADQMVTHEELDTKLEEKLEEKLEVKLEEKLNSKLKPFATKEDLSRVEHRIKAYIDDRVILERFTPMIRTEDQKVDAVIDTLGEESIFDGQQVLNLKSRGPFARLT